MSSTSTLAFPPQTANGLLDRDLRGLPARMIDALMRGLLWGFLALLDRFDARDEGAQDES